MTERHGDALANSWSNLKPHILTYVVQEQPEIHTVAQGTTHRASLATPAEIQGMSNRGHGPDLWNMGVVSPYFREA